MAKGELTARQKAFIDQYLVDLNATQAAIRAGYSEKTANREGTRLLSNVVIAKEIAKRSLKATRRAEITVQDVLDGLYKEATSFGEGTTQSARVSAWGYLGKYHKMFIDRIEADISHSFSDLSDDELDQAIEEMSGG